MKKNNYIALLPILVFLLLFAGMGILTGDFYLMPALVAFIIALGVAFLQNKSLSYNDKLIVVAKGAGDENIVTMIFIFLLAGAFSGMVQAAGGVESTVNFGLSIIPPNFAVLGLFIVGCFISISMGTSVGTIVALAPIALGISEKAGFPIALCIGAVVSGAMFGDNLSMISDTTIAAVKTQGCDLKSKFNHNFLMVLPAAIITIIILFLSANNSGYIAPENLEYNFLQIIPYLAVFIGALSGLNVFFVLIGGIVISTTVGFSLNMFTFIESFSILGTGMESMFEITIISLVVAGIVALVKANGGIDCIISFIKSKVHNRRGAEFGIALLAALLDICTANNTVAIIMAGPIAKEIGDEYEVKPEKSAAILDIFSSVIQGTIPYGAQLLTAASLVGISPLLIIPNLYYPFLMAISAIVYIAFVKDKKKGEL